MSERDHLAWDEVEDHIEQVLAKLEEGEIDKREAVEGLRSIVAFWSGIAVGQFFKEVKIENSRILHEPNEALEALAGKAAWILDQGQAANEVKDLLESVIAFHRDHA